MSQFERTEKGTLNEDSFRRLSKRESQPSSLVQPKTKSNRKLKIISILIVVAVLLVGTALAVYYFKFAKKYEIEPRKSSEKFIVKLKRFKYDIFKYSDVKETTTVFEKEDDSTVTIDSPGYSRRRRRLDDLDINLNEDIAHTVNEDNVGKDNSSNEEEKNTDESKDSNEYTRDMILYTDYIGNIYDSRMEDFTNKTIFSAYFMISKMVSKDKLGNENYLGGFDPLDLISRMNSSRRLLQEEEQTVTFNPHFTEDDYLKYLTEEEKEAGSSDSEENGSSRVIEEEDETEMGPPFMKIQFYENGTIFSGFEAVNIDSIFLEAMHEVLPKLIPQIADDGYKDKQYYLDKEGNSNKENYDDTKENDNENEGVHIVEDDEDNSEQEGNVDEDTFDHLEEGEYGFFSKESNRTTGHEVTNTLISTQENDEFTNSKSYSSTAAVVDDTTGEIKTIETINEAVGVSTQTDEEPNYHNLGGYDEDVEIDVKVDSTENISSGFKSITANTMSKMSLVFSKNSEEITDVINQMAKDFRFNPEKKHRQLRRLRGISKKNTINNKGKENREVDEYKQKVKIRNLILSKIMKPLLFSKNLANFSLFGGKISVNLLIGADIQKDEGVCRLYIQLGSSQISLLDISSQLGILSVIQRIERGKRLLQARLKEFISDFELQFPNIKNLISLDLDWINLKFLRLPNNLLDLSPGKKTIDFIIQAVREVFSSISDTIRSAESSISSLSERIKDGSLTFITELKDLFYKEYLNFVDKLKSLLTEFHDKTMEIIDKMLEYINNPNIPKELFYEQMKVIDKINKFYEEFLESFSTTLFKGLKAFQGKTVTLINDLISPFMSLVQGIADGLMNNRILSMIMEKGERGEGYSKLNNLSDKAKEVVDYIFKALQEDGGSFLSESMMNNLYQEIKSLLEGNKVIFFAKSKKGFEDGVEKTKNFGKINNLLSSIDALDGIDNFIRNKSLTFFKNHFTPDLVTNFFTDKANLNSVLDKFNEIKNNKLSGIKDEFDKYTKIIAGIAVRASKEEYAFELLINDIATKLLNKDKIMSYFNSFIQVANSGYITSLISVISTYGNYHKSYLNQRVIWMNNYNGYYGSYQTTGAIVQNQEFITKITTLRYTVEQDLQAFMRSQYYSIKELIRNEILSVLENQNPSVSQLFIYGNDYAYIRDLMGGIESLVNDGVESVFDEGNFLAIFPNIKENIINNHFIPFVESQMKAHEGLFKKGDHGAFEPTDADFVFQTKKCKFKKWKRRCEYPKTNLYAPTRYNYNKIPNEFPTKHLSNELNTIYITIRNDVASTFKPFIDKVQQHGSYVQSVYNSEVNYINAVQGICVGYINDFNDAIAKKVLGKPYLEQMYDYYRSFADGKIKKFTEDETTDFNAMFNKYLSDFSVTLQAEEYIDNNPVEMLTLMEGVVRSNKPVRKDGIGKIENTGMEIIQSNLNYGYNIVNEINLDGVNTLVQELSAERKGHRLGSRVKEEVINLKSNIETAGYQEGDSVKGKIGEMLEVNDKDFWGLGKYVNKYNEDIMDKIENGITWMKGEVSALLETKIREEEELDKESDLIDNNDTTNNTLIKEEIAQQREFDKFNNGMIKSYTVLSRFENSIKFLDDKSDILNQLKQGDFESIITNTYKFLNIDGGSNQIQSLINDNLLSIEESLLNPGSEHITSFYSSQITIPDLNTITSNIGINFPDGTNPDTSPVLTFLNKSFDYTLDKGVKEYNKGIEKIEKLNTEKLQDTKKNKYLHKIDTVKYLEKVKSEGEKQFNKILEMLEKFREPLHTEAIGYLNDFEKKANDYIKDFEQKLEKHKSDVYVMFNAKIDLLRQNKEVLLERVTQFLNSFYRIKDKIIDQYRTQINELYLQFKPILIEKVGEFKDEGTEKIKGKNRLLEEGEPEISISTNDSDGEEEEIEIIVYHDYEETDSSQIYLELTDSFSTDLLPSLFSIPAKEISTHIFIPSLDVESIISTQKNIINQRFPQIILQETSILNNRIYSILSDFGIKTLSFLDEKKINKIIKDQLDKINTNFISPKFEMVFSKIEELLNYSEYGFSFDSKISEVTLLAYQYTFNSFILKAGSHDKLIAQFEDVINTVTSTFISDGINRNYGNIVDQITERLPFESPDIKRVVSDNVHGDYFEKKFKDDFIIVLTNNSFKQGRTTLKEQILYNLDTMTKRAQTLNTRINRIIESKVKYIVSSDISKYTQMIYNFKNFIDKSIDESEVFDIIESNKDKITAFIRDNVFPLFIGIEEKYKEIEDYIINSLSQNLEEFEDYIGDIVDKINPNILDEIQEKTNSVKAQFNEYLTNYIKENIKEVTDLGIGKLLNQSEKPDGTRLLSEEDDDDDYDDVTKDFLKNIKSVYDIFTKDLVKIKSFLSLDFSSLEYIKNINNLSKLTDPLDNIKKEGKGIITDNRIKSFSDLVLNRMKDVLNIKDKIVSDVSSKLKDLKESITSYPKELVKIIVNQSKTVLNSAIHSVIGNLAAKAFNFFKNDFYTGDTDKAGNEYLSTLITGVPSQNLTSITFLFPPIPICGIPFLIGGKFQWGFDYGFGITVNENLKIILNGHVKAETNFEGFAKLSVGVLEGGAAVDLLLVRGVVEAQPRFSMKTFGPEFYLLFKLESFTVTISIRATIGIPWIKCKIKKWSIKCSIIKKKFVFDFFNYKIKGLVLGKATKF